MPNNDNINNDNINKVHAPFNFVPLSEKVFFPDWAYKISQDIPFEDGLSGSINLKITAKSPIFVRDGHRKTDNANEIHAAQLPDGRYFIPATSVKGCVRNVLEILGNCKMHIDPNARFAQREWSNQTLWPLKDYNEAKNIKGGWLKYDEKSDTYTITQCQAIYRISMAQIDKYLGGNILRNNFFDNTRLSDEQKLGSYKYKLIKDRSKLEKLHFDIADEATPNANGMFFWLSRRVEVVKSGEIYGDIVLTGSADAAKYWSPSQRNQKQGAGKFYEFVFEYAQNAKTYTIPRNEFKQYEFIYKDSDDWKYEKPRLEDKSRGVPIFFRLSGEKVKDFGFALLYKLPYQKTPAQIEQERYKNSINKIDLSECIFGFTNKEDSLRGRVQFSTFVSENGKEDKKHILLLNGPKASYYPIYIKQNAKNGLLSGNYQTYNDGSLSGWKRYHVRTNIFGDKSVSEPKIDTCIYPLQVGTEFIGKVNFFNLKLVELGALLSAITFHNTEGCFHQLGQAKPYGFGKVSIEITGINTTDQSKIEANNLMALFEKTITDMDSQWSYKVSQLITMVKNEVSDDEKYHYMKLDIDNNKNDFVEAKGGDSGKGQKYSLPTIKELPLQQIIVKNLLLDEKFSLFLEAESLLKNMKYNEAKIKYEEAKLEGFDARFIQSRINYIENEVAEIKAHEEKLQKNDKLKSEAETLISQGGLENLQAALAKYKEVQSLGIDDCTSKILELEENIKKFSQSFEDYLNDNESSFSSPGALNGRLNKWKKNHGDLSDEEKQLVMKKIEEWGDAKKFKDFKFC